MHLARLAIHRPVTTAMLLVSVIVLGSVALSRLPLQYLPAYDSPRLTIVVPYPSSAPEEVARLIVEPIEDMMGTVSHLQSISSWAKANEGRVRLEFQPGADMDLGAVEVRDRLDRVRWRLPDDVTNIFLRRWSSSNVSTLSMRVSWQGAPERLEEIVDHTIQRRLQALDGVADVSVWGLQRKKLQILIDPAQLETYGLTTFQLASFLRRNNVTMGGGAIEDGGTRYLVRSVGKLRTPEALARLPVNAEGVRLRDVADVRYAYPEKQRYERLNTGEAIGVAVYRTSTANVVDVARAVHRTLDELHQMPGMEGLEIFVYHDSSRRILKRLQRLQWAGLVGGGLALGILLLFLRNARVTLVLGVAIPISVMATFLIMYLIREGFGSTISLNLVSLSGLMLSVGMLVDNSVVVLENIVRHRQAGTPAREASVVGTQEVGQAVLVATATSVVVFLPTIFVSTGFIGRLMSEFGLVLCAALVASLIVSFSAVPLLSTGLLASATLRQAPLQNRLTSVYAAAIAWTLRHRWSVIGVAAVVFAVSVYLFVTVLVPNRDFLRTPRRQVYLKVKTSRTMPFPQVKATMERLDDLVLQRKDALEIRHVLTTIRRSGTHRMRVYFRELEQSRTSLAVLQERLLQTLPQLAGVEYQVQRGASVSGGQLGVGVQLQGPNGDVLERLALAVKEQLRHIPGVYNVETDVEREEDELLLAVDRQQAQRLNLHPRRVARTVAFAMSKRPITTMTLDDREVDITIQVGKDGAMNADQLAQLPVTGRGNKRSAHLGSLAHTQVQRAPAGVKLEDRARTTTVVVNTRDRLSMREIARDIRRRLARLTFPPGYSWKLGKNYRRLAESERDASFTLGLAVVLIYLIMAALFESVLMPVAIMLTVPFALSGVVLTFVLTGTHLNQIADLGMLILCGLVVNNGIMLVDATNQLRARGLSRTEALIQSGQQRLRPILMTVITTVAGLMPMVAPLFLPGIFGPAEAYVAVYGPIGLVVVGGLCMSTVLTLLLLPAVYALVDEGRVVARHVWHDLRR